MDPGGERGMRTVGLESLPPGDMCVEVEAMVHSHNSLWLLCCLLCFPGGNGGLLSVPLSTFVGAGGWQLGMVIPAIWAEPARLPLAGRIVGLLQLSPLAGFGFEGCTHGLLVATPSPPAWAMISPVKPVTSSPPRAEPGNPCPPHVRGADTERGPGQTLSCPLWRTGATPKGDSCSHSPKRP